MDLRLDPMLAAAYRSPSQIAKNVTEPWAERNLFCPACTSDRVGSLRANTAVLDFRCPRCAERYQLKSKSSRFGRKVRNSAYGKKMEAIMAGEAPHYVFLHYSRETWHVQNLFIIPGH